MATDYWLDNAYRLCEGLAPHTLVDVGYVNKQASRDRADRLLALVGKKNLQIAGFSRILIRLPPRKVDQVLAALPEIKTSEERPGYCWCTHTWLDGEEG